VMSDCDASFSGDQLPVDAHCIHQA
jgi:hypothetical protein